MERIKPNQNEYAHRVDAGVSASCLPAIRQIVDGADPVMQGAAQRNRMLQMAGKVRISVGLSSTEHRKLAALADDAHVSVSWLGERAISEFLERHRNGELQLPLVLNDNQRKGAA